MIYYHSKAKENSKQTDNSQLVAILTCKNVYFVNDEVRVGCPRLGHTTLTSSFTTNYPVKWPLSSLSKKSLKLKTYHILDVVVLDPAAEDGCGPLVGSQVGHLQYQAIRREQFESGQFSLAYNL